jgi:hypothetical protein
MQPLAAERAVVGDLHKPLGGAPLMRLTYPQDGRGVADVWVWELDSELLLATVDGHPFVPPLMRMPWLQTPTSFRDDISAHRDEPRVSAANLWAYLDVRDAAQAVLAALDASADGHVAVYLAAPDTFMEEKTETLISASFGQIELRRSLPGNHSVIDSTAAERLLCFRPVYSWRSYSLELG